MKQFITAIALTLFLLTAGSINLAQAQSHDLYGRWVKRAAFGNNGSASISNSVVDDNGNVYITGRFSGTLNFSDDLCNPHTCTSQAGLNNAFLVKFDAAGRYQWVVQVTDESANTNGKNGTAPVVLDYANGKILFGCSNNSNYTNGARLPRITRYTSSNGSYTELTSAGTAAAEGDNSSHSYHMQTLHTIDAATGALEAKIGDVGNSTDIFSTGTADVYAKFVNGNQTISSLHYGYASKYGSANPLHSLATTITISGSSVTATSSANYPNQQSPTGSDGSRIRRHITLPNGSQTVIHLGQDYTTQPGIPTFYIATYNNAFSTRLVAKTIHTRSIGSPPLLSCDASSNIYMATNFGDSKFWNGSGNISNSNNMNGFLGSGYNFVTNNQHNRVVLACLDQSNLNVTWAIQIGTNGASGSEQIYCSDIKTEGNYTYLTGRFIGANVSFGNGKTLSSAGNYDGFYAVYNNSNGNCLYAVRMGGANDDSNNTLSLISGGNNILIGGSYKSPSMQVDPSGRLYPITSDGTNAQAFVALYSPDLNSKPASYNSSYGDAPASYGNAVHHAYTCLRLGGLDLTKVQKNPVYAINADSDENDDGFSPQTTSEGFLDLTQANNKLETNGSFSIKAKVTSTSEAAKAIAWIDFNRNGVFDPNEASSISDVVQSAVEQSKVIEWATDIRSQIQHGKTFMRIRLSTDALLNASHPTGLFFNGEVEDYEINFNLLEVTKSVTPTVAKIGDELTYTLSLTNKSPASLTIAELFDPIPRNTVFVSASPTANSNSASVTVGGVAMQAVKWTSITIPAGDTKNYTVKFRLTGAPQLSEPGDSLIANVAFAILNADSIPSTGANCNIAVVEVVALDALNDTIMTRVNTPVTIDVLANDEFASCSDANVTVAFSSKAGYGNHGQKTVGADNKIKYTPNAGAVFIDSLRYILTGCSTNPRRDSATVYIAALQSEALNYVACNGQSIRLGMKTISGVTYHWFDHETGGAALANNSATYTVSKNANLTETFWVEARYGSIVFKRYKIELHLSDNCGGTQPPLGCAADGTVIWKEDFGGNNTNDDRVSSMPLPANVTSYTHMQTDALSGDKIYALVKHNSYTNSGNWHTDFSDHTYPNDKLRGYMFMSNASDNTNDVLYQNKIKGLCGGDIYISLWATNLNIQTPVQETQRPTFRIELCDSLNVVVASYITTVIPQTATPTWYTYGFGAYIDASYDSLTLRIYTNTAGSNAGNDFVIDDIEIRLCAPPVTVAQPRANDTLVCTGSSITLTGSYSDPAVAAPESKWLYSETGNINNPAEWTEVPGSGVSGGSNTVSNNLTLSPTITDMTGYYRMVAAEASKIDKPKCRSMSRVIYLDVVKGMIPPDIRVYVKPDAGTIALSTYIDSLPYNYTVAWEPTADFQTPNSRGILDISNWNIPRTGTYKYTVTGTSGCGTYIAKAYVQSISKYDKTETIYICKDLPNSRTLNLHRLFGLRTANETSAWTYPNDGTYNIIANNISTVAGGHHAGAKLFDVLKAFNDAGNATIVASGIYEHSLNHKKFEICYTDGTVKKTIILIVY